MKPAVPSNPNAIRATGLHDEVAGAPDDARKVYDWLRVELLRDGPGALAQLQSQGQQWLQDLGVTFSLYMDQAGADHVVPFDPFPLVIGAWDWEFLSRGLRQRMKIWNAFFRDIHTTQEILRADIIPFEWVYDDPNYRRGSVGVPVPSEVHAHVAAFDLGRDANGGWMVTQDYLSHTTGAVYALQARRVLEQIQPALLESARLREVDDYPTTLLEHLRQHAQVAASNPRVVVYTPGPMHHAYFEHSSLARQMGVPLVQGGDLIVLNSHVYFKTIGGLEPIDVIYRRIDEGDMDPLEYGSSSQIGTAGLMNCVRKGTVTIANALGSGLGDNRAIASMMHRMAKFYFNEPLLIPTCNRLVLADADQLDHVLQDLPAHMIASSRSGPDPATWMCDQLSRKELEQLKQQILADPPGFVAEPRMPFNLLPCATPDGLAMRHFGVRAFALGGEHAEIAPCVLTRFATQPNSRVISSGMGGGIKDTWVLQAEDEEEPEPPIILRSGQRRLRLGSRTADGLYWIGRYAERAENITRSLRVLQTDSLSQYSTELPIHIEPLLEALALSSGHSARFYLRKQLPKRQNLSHYLLLDPKNPQSVRHCLSQCRNNARQIREAVPPEIWVVLNRLYRLFTSPVKRNGRQAGHLDIRQALSLGESALNQFDALVGAVHKNMIGGDQWHFWNMGVCLERAINTLNVSQPVLIRRPDPLTGELKRNEDHLDTLLGMLASRYAYRSLYQSRPTPEYVTRLLFQDDQVPRSLLRNLRELKTSLAAAAETLEPRDRDESDSPLRLCGQLVSMVEYTSLKPFFETTDAGKPPRLRLWLKELGDQFLKLSHLIGDFHLNHQAFNIIR